MTLTMLATLLFAVGLVLLVAESFVPGFGVLGVLGVVSLVGGVVVCFLISEVVGVAVLGGAAVVGPVVVAAWVKMLPHTPLARRIMLPEQSAPAPVPCPPVRVGQTGVAVSELRPGGVCEFDGERLPSVSERGIIPAGSAVRVIDCTDGRAVVRVA